MLTISDLEKISRLLDEKLDQKLNQAFNEKLGLKPGQTLDDKFDRKLGIKAGQTLDDKFDEKLTPIHRQLARHEKLLRKLRRDQIVILDVLDREQIKQSKRLAVIEQHLNLN